MANRIAWIDRMRGLAILSVVVQHLTGWLDNDFVYHKLIGISNMAVFFFVSGYIIEQTASIDSMADGIKFLKKKTLQLLLPLLVWQLVCNRYFFSTDWTWWTMADIQDVFLHPCLWFLLTLYGFMSLFVGYKLLMHRYTSGGVKIVYWLLAQVCLAIVWKATGEFKLATLYLIYFALGVMVNAFSKEAWLCHKTTATISVLVICLATCFWTSGATSVMNILLKVMVSFAVIQLIYILCTECKWNMLVDRFVQRCGVCSIAIYILHWAFLPLSPYHPLLPQNELIGLLVTISFAIVISAVCCQLYGYLCKMPMVRLFLFGQAK